MHLCMCRRKGEGGKEGRRGGGEKEKSEGGNEGTDDYCRLGNFCVAFFFA